jgi:choline dehydrogenase-like flavoprotein
MGNKFVNISNLADFDDGTVFDTDLLIIGAGPAGLTIAQEFANTPTRVLLLESGVLEEAPEFIELARVESVGEPRSPEQHRRRVELHGSSTRTWSDEAQPYGVRCRVFGGSTHAWAGKSAAFDRADFAERSWVPFSGWPMSRDALDPFIDRAAHVLNLGPNVYDERLWDFIGSRPSRNILANPDLQSFFWQFSRSRVVPIDVMRFGREFANSNAPNVRVLLNATVTQINLDPTGTHSDSVDIGTIDGRRYKARGKITVIAASSIENPRLLLASTSVQPHGIGNAKDLVGRFLMDHVGARIGRFASDDHARVAKLFGFYGVRHGGRTQLYAHGLSSTAAFQERTQGLNAALYFMSDRAPDDPWDAIKRLIKNRSENHWKDIASIVSGAGVVARGVGIKSLQSHAMPASLRDMIVNTAIRFRPNLVAADFQSGGLPHKLTNFWMDAIVEQLPDPESRVTLSDRRDRFNVPLARTNWRIHDEERRSIANIARLASRHLVASGLPAPELAPWIVDDAPANGVFVDLAHSMGTTRMSADPASGVVDENCAIHGVRGLYVAGASVFPTSGHANPLLMILALATRLADRIKGDFRRASRET